MENVLGKRRYLITGSQRISNCLWASIISLGGISFLLTGFRSFLERAATSRPDKPLQGEGLVNTITSSFGSDLSTSNQAGGFSSASSTDLLGNLLEQSPVSLVPFFPQGLVMCFYGSLGLLFGLYLWCTFVWKVGNGFNEFDLDAGFVRIFRWGLPGDLRRIDYSYSIKDIEGVRVELKEGINPRRTISLRIKGKGDIPLTRIGQPISLEEIETEASKLASFLQVSLETLYS